MNIVLLVSDLGLTPPPLPRPAHQHPVGTPLLITVIIVIFTRYKLNTW